MKKINIQALAIKAAATSGGAYAAVKLNRLEMLAKMKPVMRGAIKIGIGAILPTFIKNKQTKQMAEDLGAGLTAVGAIEVASEFDKKLPSLIDAETAAKYPVELAAGAVRGVPTLNGVGQIVYDEDYSNLTNVAGSNDVMGAANDVMGGADDYTM